MKFKRGGARIQIREVQLVYKKHFAENFKQIKAISCIPSAKPMKHQKKTANIHFAGQKWQQGKVDEDSPFPAHPSLKYSL